MSATRRSKRAVAVVIAGSMLVSAAVVSVVVQSVTHGSEAHIHIDSRSAALSATTVPTTGTAEATSEPGPVVVAIGDSIMDGHNVDSSHAWPQLIGAATNWQLTDLAEDGSGFVSVGDDGSTFQDQAVEAVDLHPSMVIIAASSNDLEQDPDDVASQTMKTMRYLRQQLPDARIFALNAFWGDTTPPDELGDLDADILRASEAVDADYLDIGQPLAGHPELMQFDDIHPVSKGLTVIAAAVASAIRDAG